jgi:hypothetical protein
MVGSHQVANCDPENCEHKVRKVVKEGVYEIHCISCEKVLNPTL